MVAMKFVIRLWGKVCGYFGQSLFLGDRPCPHIMLDTALGGRFGRQSLRIKIRPFPKVPQTLPAKIRSILAGRASKKTSRMEVPEGLLELVIP